MNSSRLTRRDFTRGALLTGAAAATAALAVETAPKRIRTGLIGCGSVSNSYLPNLTNSPFVEIVSLCDIRPERAARQAEKFKIVHHYPNVEAMLAGEPFDFLVDTTDMQEHEKINRRALEAGKHVWSEKPIANSLAAGQALLRMALDKKLRLWGAPIPVQSPQFAFMAKQLAAGKLGRVAAAHADYGHEGPDWSSFFYEKLGGSLPDLGVYNLTTLTGLLGPVKRVTAMLSIVTPEREIREKGGLKSRRRTMRWCYSITATVRFRTCSLASTISTRTATTVAKRRVTPLASSAREASWGWSATTGRRSVWT
jgi:predicted dehydrogenase